MGALNGSCPIRTGVSTEHGGLPPHRTHLIFWCVLGSTKEEMAFHSTPNRAGAPATMKRPRRCRQTSTRVQNWARHASLTCEELAGLSAAHVSPHGLCEQLLLPVRNIASSTCQSILHLALSTSGND
eukprot:1138307-Pelagomonas_calceolata.AAC.1